MTGERDAIAARLRAAGCVWAEDEAALLIDATEDPDARDALIVRRVAGAPLEVVLGWVEFHGIRIAIDPGVFVPRQRSALLVDVTVGLVPPAGAAADVCCGSGALAAAIRAERPDVELIASDIDPRAVELARRNLPGIEVAVGDLTRALAPRFRGRLDVILANVPYVPSAEITLLPPEARDHEPRGTLDGGTDGLVVLRRLLAEASPWLREGGSVVSEIAPSQLASATDAARGAGLTPSAELSSDGETVALVATLAS